jgi:hypothetical protein
MKYSSIGMSAGAAIGVLALLTMASPVMAQDSSSVRRDTSISGAASDSSAPANATSRINQRERQDSLNQPGQNPPGYRGMERPAGLDSAAATAQDSTGGKAHAGKKSGMKHKHSTKTKNAAGMKQQTGMDSTGQDSTKWGYKVDKSPKHQNPPGYRGMERPAGLDSAARQDSAGGRDSTSTPGQQQ